MQQASPQPRLRVRYKKDGRLAFLGHLEVINTHNRSIRRSGVPFAVGNGFARRMRLQFSQALPVGAYLEKVFSHSIDNTLRNYASSFKQEGRIYKVARKGETSVRITRIS